MMDFSNLVAACEEAWRGIQTYNPEVPDVVVVVGSGGRQAMTLYGHFAKNTWELDGNELHEVLIVAEQLHRGAEEVFNTLIHEAVHGVALVRGIKDVSGKRHNKKFANLAEEMGLEAPEKPSPRLGFSDVKLTEPMLTIYKDVIEGIEEQLKFVRKLKLVEKETKKTTWIAECTCLEPRKLRLPKKTIDDPSNLEIKCGQCDEWFELIPEDYDVFVEMFNV